jgi:shikimate kinase
VNIVLIGYRCTGKTSVGLALANRLRRPFCDADDYIEEKANRSITDMVAKEGWDFFRTKEKEAVRDLSSSDDHIIAAGGGVVLDAENVDNLKKNGVIVLLEATTQVILERMERDKKTDQQRPGLTGKGPYEEIEEVLELRMPLYRNAMDFSVDTTSKSLEQILDEIVQKLERHEGS